MTTYTWTDNVMRSGTACNVDMAADNFMYLKDNKADIDLNNLTLNGKSKIAQYATPSANATSLTLGVSGLNYIAPADGYISLSKRGGGTGQYMYLDNLTGRVGSCVINSTLGWDAVISVPVKKGDIFKVTYTYSGITTFFGNIYLEGSKP